MTVSSQINIVTFTGDGVATEFAFTFPVYAATHLVVHLMDIDTGEIDRTYDPGELTVDGVGDENGGSVTINDTAPDSDHKVILVRLVDYTQALDVENQGGFFPDNFERQLDFLEMQIQQLRERSNRSVRGFLGETFDDLPGPGGRENTFLGFDSSGVLALFEDTGDTSTLSLSRVVRAPVGETLTELPAAASRLGKYLRFHSGTGDVELATAGGATLSDGDYGSVTVSGSGTVITIDNLAVVTAMLQAAAVTYAKIQNVSATDKILGRVTAGAGVIEEITFTDLAQTLATQTSIANFLTALGFSSFFQTLIDETTGGAVLTLLGGANGTITEGSLAAAGYVVFEASALLGADLMFQWGDGSLGTNASATITYPVPFATFSRCVVSGGPSGGGSEGSVECADAVGTTTGQAIFNSSNDDTITYTWFAWGDK